MEGQSVAAQHLHSLPISRVYTDSEKSRNLKVTFWKVAEMRIAGVADFAMISL